MAKKKNDDGKVDESLPSETEQAHEEIVLLVPGLLDSLGAASALATREGRHTDHAAIEEVVQAAYSLKQRGAAVHCLGEEDAGLLARVLSLL